MLGLETRTEPVDYLEIGKGVFATGIGGALGGYVHFQFLSPRFAGQNWMGVKFTTIVDIIAGFIVGTATFMYAKNVGVQIFGYGITSILVALGLLDQFNMIPTGVAARRVTVSMPAAVARQASITRTAMAARAGRYATPVAATAGRYTLTG